VPLGLGSPRAIRIAQLVRRAPGPLGEALVLPWAVAAPDLAIALHATDGMAAPQASGEPSSPARPSRARPPDVAALLREATELAARLTAEAWSAPAAEAQARARASLRELRGDEPGRALARFATLRPPDPAEVAALARAIGRLREALVAAGIASDEALAWHVDPATVDARPERGDGTGLQRVGIDRWEAFAAAVAMATAPAERGVPAAGGVGAGRLAWVPDPRAAHVFRPRDVLVTPRPLPHLAPLLWDAAAAVTVGGGPGAHLFESARALGIPAVAGLKAEAILTAARGDTPVWLAVDGWAGDVFLTPW
jgi:hypothetical protein